MSKVRVITGILGDRSGSWVAYEDYQKLETLYKQLEQELEDDYLIGIAPPDPRLEDEDVPF